jgi:adenylate cyclase class 2
VLSDRGDVSVVIDLITGVDAFAETEVMAGDPDAAATLLGQVGRQLGMKPS